MMEHTKNNQTIIVIPARHASSRFPGKPLALVKGITLIERVWRIAKLCHEAQHVYIATDDPDIAFHAKSFHADVLMTSPDCYTGTDRVAEAAASFAKEEDIIFSIQGDAVLTPPWVIDAVIDAMKRDPSISIATPAVKLTDKTLIDFLNHKKISPSSGTSVVFDKNGKALYFSKYPIPFQHTQASDNFLYRHIGLYGYRYKMLKHLQTLSPSPLEKQEKLEQLRALENSIPIQVVPVDYQGRSHGSIDTPEDIHFVENIISKEGELVSPQQMNFRVGAKPPSDRNVYRIHEDREVGAGNNPENLSAKGMKVFLLRHGNTFNTGEVPYQIGCRTDLPLTEKGIQQAKQFANHLQHRRISPTAIYSGTLQRQIQTAQTIHTFFPHVPLFINEHAFNEIDYGLWEGLSSEAIQSKWPQEYRAWQEERIWPSHIFLTRWQDHIDLLKKWVQHIQENALIISSNGILRLMLHFVLNNEKNADKVSTGHYCELIFDQHFQAAIESWNRYPD